MLHISPPGFTSPHFTSHFSLPFFQNTLLFSSPSHNHFYILNCPRYVHSDQLGSKIDDMTCTISTTHPLHQRYHPLSLPNQRPTPTLTHQITTAPTKTPKMHFLGTALALLASSSVVLALPGHNAAQISCAVVFFLSSLPPLSFNSSQIRYTIYTIQDGTC